jgi:hypothetical protein
MDEAQIAAQIWAESQPHAPAALLAYLYQVNLPFPYTGRPAVAPGLPDILAFTGWAVERYGYEYLHFRCPVCRTNIFEPVTGIGMGHARRAARWHVTACPIRAAWNEETIWPDSLGA